MIGSETLTAVLSMKVIAEPRIAAINTHGTLTLRPSRRCSRLLSRAE